MTAGLSAGTYRLTITDSAVATIATRRPGHRRRAFSRTDAQLAVRIAVRIAVRTDTQEPARVVLQAAVRMALRADPQAVVHAVFRADSQEVAHLVLRADSWVGRAVGSCAVAGMISVF
ncbi:hypothetical protein GCM10009733_097630 [Nonomuraea maheshkhaliensis]|uniref:Uncharacterized protein n=1 Tax=Nonomuraea maheshkhaliensis TaxID=419590 RepID=A0ABN2HC47_9ACTN